MTAKKTEAAARAQRQSTEARLRRLDIVLSQMERDGAPIIRAEVERKSGVSRSFLYQNAEAKSRIEAAIGRSADALARAEEIRSGETVHTWRERALNAEAELSRAVDEISVQRRVIGEHLGHIRALEDAVPADGVQRIVSENLTLKRRLHDAEAEASGTAQKLSASRETNRFLEKRLADTEMDLLEARRDAEHTSKT